MSINIALTTSALAVAWQDAHVIILVFVVTLLAVAWLLQYYRCERQSQLPPGPWHVPFLGSPQLFTQSSHIQVTKLGKTYGKAFTLYIGSDPLIVLNDYHLIKEALVQQGDIFSDRFTFKTMERTINLKGSLIFENGRVWKTRRRVTLAALHNIGGTGGKLESLINKEVGCLCQEICQQAGQPFEPFNLVSTAVANIICCLSYGRRFEYSDPVFKHVLSNLDSVLHCSFVGSVLKTMPVISQIPGLNGMRQALNEVFDFNRSMVREHKARFDPDNIGDVIDAMLKEGQKEEQCGTEETNRVFTDELIARAIYDLFAAGTDTNTNTLLWALLLMTQYPDVQTKVQQEIDAVIGATRCPMISDSTSMPYTTATIMEIHRYRVAAPFVPPRRTTQDVDLHGIWIPKGTQIWVNLWAVLHDPSLWANPESFQPCRFLADDGKRVIVPEAFIPFGAGRRICLGKQLSTITIFLCFTNILQRFDVSWPVEGAHQADLQGQLGLTLAPKKYRICAMLRQSSVQS